MEVKLIRDGQCCDCELESNGLSNFLVGVRHCIVRRVSFYGGAFPTVSDDGGLVQRLIECRCIVSS